MYADRIVGSRFMITTGLDNTVFRSRKDSTRAADIPLNGTRSTRYAVEHDVIFQMSKTVHGSNVDRKAISTGTQLLITINYTLIVEATTFWSFNHSSQFEHNITIFSKSEFLNSNK